MASSEILAGYRYDSETGRYISSRTGRPISRQELLRILSQYEGGVEQQLGELTRVYHEDEIAPAVWLLMFALLIRRAHTNLRALGAGGFDQMDRQDFFEVTRVVRDDTSRLPAFAAAVVAGELSIAQALARARRYAGNARIQFWEADKRRTPVQDDGVILFKRTLGTAEHCEDCVSMHEGGWAFDWPVPGTGSICGQSCHCEMEAREVPVDQVSAWLGTRRR